MTWLDVCGLQCGHLLYQEPQKKKMLHCVNDVIHTERLSILNLKNNKVPQCFNKNAFYCFLIREILTIGTFFWDWERKQPSCCILSGGLWSDGGDSLHVHGDANHTNHAKRHQDSADT